MPLDTTPLQCLHLSVAACHRASFGFAAEHIYKCTHVFSRDNINAHVHMASTMSGQTFVSAVGSAHKYREALKLLHSPESGL